MGKIKQETTKDGMYIYDGDRAVKKTKTKKFLNPESAMIEMKGQRVEEKTSTCDSDLKSSEHAATSSHHEESIGSPMTIEHLSTVMLTTPVASQEISTEGKYSHLSSLFAECMDLKRKGVQIRKEVSLEA